MKELSDQRFFRLLSECSQKEVVVNDLTTALQELANHLANIVINEQDYAVLLRYFTFGLNRLKSYRSQFGRGGNALLLLVDEAIGLVNTRNPHTQYANQISSPIFASASKSSLRPVLTLRFFLETSFL